MTATTKKRTARRRPPASRTLEKLDAHERAATWTQFAACAGEPAGLWFTERNDPAAPAKRREAKAICAECPVQTDCVEYAIVTVQTHGMWGGRSERELRRLRSARSAARRFDR